MPIPDKLYEQVALHDPDGHWELHDGQLVRKPAMTSEHNYIFRRLGRILSQQLDAEAFDVAVDNARLRVSTCRYYVPDVCVIPMDLVRRRLTRSPRLEVFDEPLPLVVEVWSPSTGDYDVDSKLPEYQRRGDLEIWRIHPYERTVTVRRREPDGRYTEMLYYGGTLRPATLRGVIIDLDYLFALLQHGGE